MKLIKAIVPLALLVALALIAYPLYAHCGKCAADGKKIVTQLDQNKMTLAKAVTTAEAHSKGRAVTVISELDGSSDKLMLEVYCIAADKIQKCDIDGSTGSVVGMKEVSEFPITEDDHTHPHTPGKSDPRGTPGAPGGAGGGSAKMISNQPAEVGCGMCVYKMSGVEECHLAVMLDGKPYLVQGATWPNHDFCDRKLQAIVTGRIQGDKFVATTVTPQR